MLKEPVILEVAKDTYLFNLMGMQSPALIVGAERAMLIDTGLGNVDMTEQVRRVTDKPIMLVLSHAHSDHMGGIGQFEDIYLHPADIPAQRLLPPLIWLMRRSRPSRSRFSSPTAKRSLTKTRTTFLSSPAASYRTDTPSTGFTR